MCEADGPALTGPHVGTTNPIWRAPRRTLETAGDRPGQEADVHIPDGFINAPTSAIGGVIAAGLVVLSVRKAAVDLDDRQVPLAGLTAAFIFAVQMLNFPVAGGTSGHLLGGCLAAILVGPWVGGLVMSVVLPRAGPGFRRRRTDGARPEHHRDGLRPSVRRLRAVPAVPKGVASQPACGRLERRSGRVRRSPGGRAAVRRVLRRRRRRETRRWARSPSRCSASTP